MANALCTKCHLPRGTIAMPNPANLICPDCGSVAATSYHAATEPARDPFRGVFSQFGPHSGGGGGSGRSIFGGGGGGGGFSVFGGGGGGGGGFGGANGSQSAHHYNGSSSRGSHRPPGFSISDNTADHDIGVSLHGTNGNDNRPADARFSPIVTEPVSCRPRLVSPAQRRAQYLDSASSWAPLTSPTLVTAAETMDTVRPWVPLSSPALVSTAKAEAVLRGAARENVLASSASGSSIHSRVMNANRELRPHFLYRDFDQAGPSYGSGLHRPARPGPGDYDPRRRQPPTDPQDDQGYSRHPWT